MYRIRSPIDFEDIVIMRDAAIRRDPIFHETPHHSPETLLARDATPTMESLGEFELNRL